MTHEQEFLRPADLAVRLGVSRSRIYQLLASGELPAVRLGGAIRVPKLAWQAWLERQRDRALEALQQG